MNIDKDEPVFGAPLSVAGGFERTPVFNVEIHLRAPGASSGELVPWRLHLGARSRWRLPFAVLLGQRGWFDTFPTRIDATSCSVDVPGRVTA